MVFKKSTEILWVLYFSSVNMRGKTGKNKGKKRHQKLLKKNSKKGLTKGNGFDKII